MAAAAGVLGPLAVLATIFYRKGDVHASDAISAAVLGVLFGAVTGTGPMLISCLLTKCGMVSGAIFSKVVLIWYTLLAGSSAEWVALFFVEGKRLF